MVRMMFSRSEKPGITGATRNLTGPKAWSKTKISEGDIVVISAPDINRATAQRFIDAGVAGVVNTAQFTTGQVPNFGPQMLLDAGIELVENVDPDITEKVKNGKKGRLEDGHLYYGDRSLGSGAVLDLDASMQRFDDARSALGDHLDALAGNTAELARSESPLLIDGLGIPDVDVDMVDRKVMVISPLPDLKDELRDLRFFLREYDPIIIAIESAADDLLELGYRPAVIVGNPENIGSESLRSGATVVLPAEADGYAQGLERIQDLGVGAMTFPAATKNPTDLALLLADYHGASMVVHLGEKWDLERVFSETESQDTPSALLARLRVGPKFVDASSIAELYRVSKSGSGWLWALIGVLVAILVIILIAGFSGDAGFVDNLIDSWNNLALSVQGLFKN